MDSLENKIRRLRELRANQCCKHIDQEIKSWLNVTDPSPQPPPPPPVPPVQGDVDGASSGQETIGCFLSNLKHLESLDSDATESTSSNDSYDELEGFSHEEIPPKRTQIPKLLHHQRRASHQHSSSSMDGLAHHHHNTSTSSQAALQHGGGGEASQAASDLRQKAIWRWAQDRGRLASKWTWLQAQISDLEYRVRHTNIAATQSRERKMPPLPQVLPESACSRTVPLNRDFRQRRLIKSSQILADSGKSSVKFSHVPCVCSSLPQTVAPCLSCKGRYNYLRQTEGEIAPVLERASLLDPSCHPVLSIHDDITLGSQLAYLLRQETVVRKPTKGKPGRKKGSTSAQSLNSNNNAATTNNNDKPSSNSNKHGPKKGKYYPNMSNRPSGYAQAGHHANPSQTMIACNKLKRKYSKHSSRLTQRADSSQWSNGGPGSGGYHNHYNNSTKRNKRIRSASSMNESALHSDSSNPHRPNNFANSQARNITRRRRSEQSAYDIDNIVIPFSVAATARVEILEYKEILTPSWRLLENGVHRTPPDTSTNNKKATNESPALEARKEEDKEEEEEDIEDTSDEVYIQRHTKGEREEKKRFSLKPPPKNELKSEVKNETKSETNKNDVPNSDT